MQGSQKKRFLLILMLSLLTVSCTTPATSHSPQADWPMMRPISANALILVPHDFEKFVYMSSYKGVDERHPLGEYAMDQMGVLFRNAFASATSMPVRSESEAMRMISSNDPELRAYDLVIVPKFMDVNSWARDREYGFDVNVVLEIYSPDSALVEKIRGHGESKTGAYAGSSPQQSARLALTYALDAVKDGLEMRRSALSANRR